MKLGIIGLPNVGKSTLFNALTAAGAQAANYPFCTIEPNIGIVPVPDKRLDILTEMYIPEKTTPATIEFVDIAGLVKGASQGEGLGNRFLAHIREMDALVHVVRCFEDDNITHVDGDVEPIRDMATIETELILADLETLQKRKDRLQKMIKGGDKTAAAELALAEKLLPHLNDGATARSMELTADEAQRLANMDLLTAKPVIYAINIDEMALADDGQNNLFVQAVQSRAAAEGAGYVLVSAKVEAELAELTDEENMDFLSELGISESGLDRLVSASYALLGLISYLTAGPKEVRAWTIQKGMKAPQAAGKIHSDFERGFIRAEVVAYDTLVECGSIAAAREKGLYRSEGKEYVIADGDVVLFRFNV